MQEKYKKNLVGMQFGHLTVYSKSCKTGPSIYDYWDCLCDCGNKKTSNSYNLLNGKSNSCGSNHSNLVGKKFSCLLVQERVPNEKGNQARKWLCKCDCGNTIVFNTYRLTHGRVTNCGCKRKNKKRFFYYTWYDYKDNAKCRGILFNLTKDDFVTLIQSNCYYCGTKPKSVNGIDRVDNNRGYEKDNCVSCCHKCNRAKLNKSLEDFINWAIRLKNNLISKTTWPPEHSNNVLRKEL